MFVHPLTRCFSEQALPDVGALAVVRRAFVDWMEYADIPHERIEDLSVVISELGANAVRATPVGGQPATACARLDERQLVLEVANEVDAGTETTIDWDLEDPLRTGGRGLLLVSAFVDDVDTTVVDGRLVVRCIASV